MPAFALKSNAPFTAIPTEVFDVLVALAKDVTVLDFAFDSITYFNSLLSIYAVLPSIGNVPTV